MELFYQSTVAKTVQVIFLQSLSICYGWRRWSNQQHQKATSLKRLSSKQWALLCVIIIAIYTIIFNVLTSMSHSNVAKLDALTTSLSFVAQGLMCYKMIATWVLWFIADTLFAFMYWHKELPFHTILMMAYTGMAVIGYLRWFNLPPEEPSLEPLNQTSDAPTV